MTCPKLTDAMFPDGPLAILRNACKGTEAHPAAVGAHFIVAAGNLAGRGAYTYVGDTRHGTNENTAIVGKTGSGRKGMARDMALAPFHLVDEPWTRRIRGGLSSGEGLIFAVRDPVVTTKNGEPVVTDSGVADKRLLVVETEASGVFKQFVRDGNTLSNFIRQAWDGDPVLGTLTKNAPTVATDAHIAIIMHATPEDLRAHLSDIDIANGLVNRSLIIVAERENLVPSPRRMADADRQKIAGVLCAVRNRVEAKDQYLDRTPNAARLWNTSLYEKLTKDGEWPGLLGSLLARGAAHVTRLSLIFALLDHAERVDVQHLKAACAWWGYVVASTREVFRGRTGNRLADRIRTDMLVGQRLKVSEINKVLFSNHAPAGPLADAITLLVDLGDGKIEANEDTGGRPAKVFVRVDATEGPA